MPVILDKELYDIAKQIADEKYIKPSAYKSGYIVKKYKELGGRYGDDGEEKKLKRWFDEDWKDIGGLDYPVFRPTRRVNKDTPLTPNEIDKNNLTEQILTKQVIRGNANLKPFKKRKIWRKMIEPIDMIPKNDTIWNYSNPKEAQEKAYEYLGKDAVIYRSDRSSKKYKIYDPINDKWVHFGTMNPPMEDYTKHKDYQRMEKYRSRAANIKGDWKSNPYSPNNLSINILW